MVYAMVKWIVMCVRENENLRVTLGFLKSGAMLLLLMPVNTLPT